MGRFRAEGEPLERKLKRLVAGKDWSQKRKDAYVYGTLRRTGWTPSREKKKSVNGKVRRV